MSLPAASRALIVASIVIVLAAPASAAAKKKPTLAFSRDGVEPIEVPFGDTARVAATCPGGKAMAGGPSRNLGGSAFGDVDQLSDGPTADGRGWFLEARHARNPEVRASIDLGLLCARGAGGIKATSSGPFASAARAGAKKKKKKPTVEFTTFRGLAVNVAAQATGSATARCPTGSVATSAGIELNGVRPVRDFPTADGTGWTSVGRNPSGQALQQRVTVVCAKGKRGLKVIEEGTAPASARSGAPAAGAAKRGKPTLRFRTVAGPRVIAPPLGNASPEPAAQCPVGYVSLGAGLDLGGLYEVLSVSDGDDPRAWFAGAYNPSDTTSMPFQLTVRCVAGSRVKLKRR